MASTEAGICNLALARIGQREFIDALDDDTTAAQVCNAIYVACRDELLESFPWPWATRRAVLAEVADAAREGWTYVYALPSGCLAARKIWPGTRVPSAAQRIPFALESDSVAGTVLLCDEEAAELSYTAAITTVTLFPPLFVDALAWRLAAELALALAVKPQVGLAMSEQFNRAMARAQASALRQSQEDAQPDSEFVTTR